MISSGSEMAAIPAASKGASMAAIRLRIGTRKSAMALAQTAEIARRLAAAVPGIDVEIVKFETTGGYSIRRASRRDAFAQGHAGQ
jgi:hypothetical protein